METRWETPKIPLESSDDQTGFCCSLSHLRQGIGQQMWLSGESQLKACARKRVLRRCQRTEAEFQCLPWIQSLCSICPALVWVSSGEASWWSQGLWRWAGVGISCCVQEELQREVVQSRQVISEYFPRVLMKLGPSKTIFLAPHSHPVISRAVHFTCSNLLSYSLIIMRVSLGFCCGTGSGSSCIKRGSERSCFWFSVQHWNNGINICSPAAC